MINKQFYMRMSPADLKNIAFLKKKTGYERTSELLRHLIVREVERLKS